MHRITPLLLLVAASGCRNEYSTLTPILELVVSVSTPQSRAGEPIQYLAYIEGPSTPVDNYNVLSKLVASPAIANCGGARLVDDAKNAKPCRTASLLDLRPLPVVVAGRNRDHGTFNWTNTSLKRSFHLAQ